MCQLLVLCNEIPSVGLVQTPASTLALVFVQSTRHHYLKKTARKQDIATWLREVQHIRCKARSKSLILRLEKSWTKHVDKYLGKKEECFAPPFVEALRRMPHKKS